MEGLEAWVMPYVEYWARGVRVLDKLYVRYPNMDYADMDILLQL